MRIAVVYFPAGSPERIRGIAEALGKGVESRGHRVDLFNGNQDTNVKLSIYDFVALGAEGTTFWGSRIPGKVSTFLSGAGHITGKRSFAFVIKRFGFPYRALSRLMKAMEHEGMYLKSSEVLKSPVESQEIGKRLKVEPN